MIAKHCQAVTYQYPNALRLIAWTAVLLFKYLLFVFIISNFYKTGMSFVEI